MNTARFKEVHCNCCKRTMEEYVQQVLRPQPLKDEKRKTKIKTANKPVSTGVIPLLYRTPSKAIVCSRCVETNTFVLSHGGKPLAVYKVDTSKFSVAADFEQLYNPDMVLETYEVTYEQADHTHLAKDNGKKQAITNVIYTDKDSKPQATIEKEETTDLVSQLYTVDTANGEELETEVFE